LTAACLLNDLLAYIGDFTRARAAAVAALGPRAVGAARADEARGRGESVGDPGNVQHRGYRPYRVLRGVRYLRLASLLAGVHEADDDGVGVDAVRAQRRHQVDADRQHVRVAGHVAGAPRMAAVQESAIAVAQHRDLRAAVG